MYDTAPTYAAASVQRRSMRTLSPPSLCAFHSSTATTTTTTTPSLKAHRDTEALGNFLFHVRSFVRRSLGFAARHHHHHRHHHRHHNRHHHRHHDGGWIVTYDSSVVSRHKVGSDVKCGVESVGISPPRVRWCQRPSRRTVQVHTSGDIWIDVGW
ncbi:hypothetical protein HDK77DRAFT_274986 [Phyllosticta capitalensis]